MFFDSYLLLQAAEVAVAHLATTASTLHHEAHVFLEEITNGPVNLHHLVASVNGGCTNENP